LNNYLQVSVAVTLLQLRIQHWLLARRRSILLNTSEYFLVSKA